MSYQKNHIETIVRFGHGGNSTEYEAYGWHLPEEGFTWTRGSESCLHFPKYDAPYGIFIEFEVQSAGLQALVSANGQQVGELITTGSLLAAFYIPALDYTARMLLLTIKQARPHFGTDYSPVSSVAFVRIRIAVLDEPMTPRSERSSSIPVMEPAAAERLTSISLTTLASKFESLGRSCELGFVQRRCGVEPLSLLRFAAIPLPCLVDAIDSGFEGLDRPDNLVPEGVEAWDIRDKIYRIFYHTCRPHNDITADEIKQSEARRLRFLIRKFMGHLKHPTKMFVWWDYSSTTEAEIIPVFLALRRRGPVPMLWVTKGEPAGTVEEIWPGLLRARISGFSHDGGQPDPLKSFSAWLEIMANSWLLTGSNLVDPSLAK